MPWWGWIVVGVVLLVGEMVADAQFYLIFLGAAAVLVGLLGFAGLSRRHRHAVGDLRRARRWCCWSPSASACTGRCAAPRRAGHETIVGEIAIVQLESIAPGVLGRVELRGTNWTGRNVGGEALGAGQRAQVVSLEGLVIDIRRAD